MKTNALARYLSTRGVYAKRELRDLVKRKTRRTIRWATLHDIANGRAVPRVQTARLLHLATDGEIDAGELLGLTPHNASTSQVETLARLTAQMRPDLAADAARARDADLLRLGFDRHETPTGKEGEST